MAPFFYFCLHLLFFHHFVLIAIMSLLNKASLFSLLAASSVAAQVSGSSPASDSYVPADYVWTSQSLNSSQSMPLGGCNVGLNVWVEDGDLLLYMCQSGWLDENGTLLKAGRLRLHFSDDPFASSNFSQRLVLAEGRMVVSGADLSVNLWVDSDSPCISIDVDGRVKREVSLSFESWRDADRTISKDEAQQCSFKWLLPSDCVTRRDSFDVCKPGSVDPFRWYHVLPDSTMWNFTVQREGLSSIASQLYNPYAVNGRPSVLSGVLSTSLPFRSTGSGVYASTSFKSWVFSDVCRKASVRVDLRDGSPCASSANLAPNVKRSRQYWRDFWNRSFVFLPDVNANDSARTIVRNYELMRFMLGCVSQGLYPSKFNGSLFTFDPVFVDSSKPFSPDYRRWGGATMTAQNQRLLYWPLVKSADIQLLRIQLDTYLRMLPNAMARTRFYWGHDGASFTEQIENSGLPNPAEAGKLKPGKDPGVERNAWLEYLWDTSLEFCQMALDANQRLDMDISVYENLIWQCLSFFDLHYQWMATRLGSKPLNADGKLVIYPGSGCETFKMAYNPSSTVAALQCVGNSWLHYLSRVHPTDSTRLADAKSIISRVPDIPLTLIDGRVCIAPATVWARVQNVESPQLYPVFPWRIYGVGRPDLQVAINTWRHDPHVAAMRSAKGWKQDAIWAACLGLADEAASLLYDKLKDGPYRFPAFYDPGFDWAPDFNRGGSGMIALQEMLLQFDSDGGRIELPAWPSRWGRVVYKLY